MLTSTVLAFLLFFGCQNCWAQSGYNYARPELGAANVPTAGGRGGGLVTLPAAAYPTAAATAAAVGPQAGGVGAYGAYTPAGGLVAQTPTAYGGSAVLKRPTATAPTTRGGSSNFGLSQSQYNPRVVGGQPTSTGTGTDADYNDGDYSAIPGAPGVDYPVYAQVPRTNFDCAQQPLPGYYADIEAQCQVFHICALNRTYSFLCPNGTVFSQETLVCVWWNQYDCVSAPSLYANNAYIYDYEQRGPVGGAGVGVGLGGSVQQGAIGASNLNAGYGLRSQLTTNTARTPSTGGGGAVSGYTPARGYTPTPTTVTGPAGAAQFGAVLRPGPSGAISPIATAAGGGGAYAQPTGQIGPQVLGSLGGGGGGGSVGQQAASANREYLPPSPTGRRNT